MTLQSSRATSLEEQSFGTLMLGLACTRALDEQSFETLTLQLVCL